MFRVGTWLYGKKPVDASTQRLDQALEFQNLRNAMGAATLILNDDVEGAEEGLSQGHSSFHKLGKGLVGFMRASLGFEQDIMREASERLNEAEISAASNQHKAQYHIVSRSQIYDPGTEYALCQAMAQILSAIIGVLNESLTESIKGFYKLRKAFITLDSILKMEGKFLQSQRIRKSLDSSRDSPALIIQPRRPSSASALDGTTDTEKPDVLAKVPGFPKDAIPDHQLPDLSDLKGKEKFRYPAHKSASAPVIEDFLFTQHPSDEITHSQMDIFVHSGANFCFGMMLLLISMVPPAFSRLLLVIGFRGDRQRGLRMLWQASKFPNFMGAIASFVLLGYYNGFVRYCDIVSDLGAEDERGIEGYPADRLMSLLTEIRSRYPKSQLWLLEESRMMGANRNLEAALELVSNTNRSPLKQVEALRVFERSMNAMCLHRYELCSESFLECVTLNSWSRTLYYYIAGSAHLALYRQHAQTDHSLAAEHAKKATELFRKAPAHGGKKRFMARQLPFDAFVIRKVAKWEARAQDWKVDLADAVGVDPLEEMIFLWNGHNRMTAEQLEVSLGKLAWSESEANPHWTREGPDERTILHVLRAAILRVQRRHQEAKEILQTEILCHPRAAFKSLLVDDWTAPTAYFEMAANLWMERPSYKPTYGDADLPCSNPTSDSDSASTSTTGQIPDSSAASDDTDLAELEREKVSECKKYLDKVAKWETYILDARIGLKVTAAEEAIRKWEASHPVTNFSASGS